MVAVVVVDSEGPSEVSKDRSTRAELVERVLVDVKGLEGICDKDEAILCNRAQAAKSRLHRGC
jgi:hypothetical protein